MKADFGYGRFWGITAPMALLLNKEDIEILAKCVTSMTGYKVTENFKVELELLKKWINSVPVVRDDSAWLSRWVDGVKFKNTNQLDRYLHKHKKGEIAKKLTDEEVAEIERHRGSAKKAFSGQIRGAKGIEEVSDECAKIIQFVVDNAHMIDEFLNTIKKVRKSRNYSIETFFDNVQLTRLLRRGEAKYYNYLVNANYYNKCRYLEENKAALVEYLESMKNDCEHILEMKNVQEEERKIPVDDLNEFIQELREDKLYNSILCEEILDTSMRNELLRDKETCLELLKTLSFIVGIDATEFNGYFGLNASEDSYKDLFLELENIGLIGFYFQAKDFMFEMIKMTTVNEVIETAHVISPDSGLYKNTRLLYIDIKSRLGRC